ncbi:MAG TPA: hypothetical protein VGB55_04840 [Tepidisphaeraceae bacterium]|jgi:hypothetical protein
MSQSQGQSNKHAALNDRKERAAGRVEQNPQLNPALDPDNTVAAKGQTGGAFGKDGHAHRNQALSGGGSGGGGGSENTASDLLNTGPKE